MLRLLRDDLGAKTFKAENRRFRDAGRLLAASRDAEVKMQTLAALERRFGGELPLAPSRAWAGCCGPSATRPPPPSRPRRGGDRRRDRADRGRRRPDPRLAAAA